MFGFLAEYPNCYLLSSQLRAVVHSQVPARSKDQLKKKATSHLRIPKKA